MRRIPLAFVTIAPALCLAQELLTLENAIDIAVRNNPSLQAAFLESKKFDQKIAALRTRLFPNFSVSLYGAQQITPIVFTFDRGLFGTFPGIGPVPGTDTEARAPLRPTGLVNGRIVQPITQIRKIHLNQRLLELSRDLAREQARLQRQDVVRDVRRAYYDIQLAEASRRSIDQAVALYRELEQLTARYLAQQVALPADHLDMQGRLARAEESLATLLDQTATAKERLNQILGRDLLTEYQVAPPAEIAESEDDVSAAAKQAAERSPEVVSARLRIAQAEQDHRVARGNRAPDLSVDYQNLSLLNYNKIIPRTINSVGISLTWEPYDWGRKKHEEAEKTIVVEQARHALRQTETLVQLAVRDAHRKLRQARAQLSLARMDQQTAAESLRVVKNRYAAEAALLKDVLEKQAAFEQSNRAYQQALTTFWGAKADWGRALGEER
ncbi:MAG: TolC family protein [Acidobacteria bacterium]|nr:TolC family protein [Acidobacteriota bacterium]